MMIEWSRCYWNYIIVVIFDGIEDGLKNEMPQILKFPGI